MSLNHCRIGSDSLVMPKVSVIIPNFNYAHYLRQRLDSVLGQTLKDIEVLYLDDASRDGSREVLESYLPDPRSGSSKTRPTAAAPTRMAPWFAALPWAVRLDRGSR